MQLYHGASQLAERPRYTTNRTQGDFGRGFYCAEQEESAAAWACAPGADGFVGVYALETDGARVLDLRSAEYGVLPWLALVTANRRFAAGDVAARGATWLQTHCWVNLDAWDVVIGWRAGDSVFSCVRAFLRNEVSHRVLCQMLEGAETQVMLRAPGVFSGLRLRSYRPVDALDCVPRRKSWDAALRSGYAAARAEDPAAFAPPAPIPAGRAYGAQYLQDAMDTLGEALSYAVHGYGMEADDFLTFWISSGLAERFAQGWPAELVGRSGMELAETVLTRCGVRRPPTEYHAAPLDGPEAWCGRTLAYFQWYTGQSFRVIQQALPAGELLRLAPALEGLTPRRLLEVLSQMQKRSNRPTMLQTLRRLAGYSQRALATASGVSLRMIQQYEQRAKEIGKASAASLLALARVLGCAVEDLVEPAEAEEP